MVKKKKKENKKLLGLKPQPHHMILVYLDVKEIHYLNSFLKFLCSWVGKMAQRVKLLAKLMTRV